MEIERRNLFLHSLANIKYFFRYYRKAILALLLFGGIILGGIAFSIEFDPNNIEGFDPSNPPLGLRTAYNMIDVIAGTQMPKEIAKDVSIYYDGGSYSFGGMSTSTVQGAIDSVHGLCMGVACLFIIISFFLSLLQIRSQDQMDEELLRRIGMLIFGFALVFFSKQISLTIANAGTMMTNQIIENASDREEDMTDAASKLKAFLYFTCEVTAGAYSDSDPTNIDLSSPGAFFSSVGEALNDLKDFVEPKWLKSIKLQVTRTLTGFGYCVDLFLPYVFVYLSRIIVNTIIWGRAIEIIIMVSFSPLAFMDIPDIHSLGRGPGMRFIKSMVALSISGAIIVFAIIVFGDWQINALMSFFEQDPSTGNMTNHLTKVVCLCLAETGVVSRAQSIGKSVVGMG